MTKILLSTGIAILLSFGLIMLLSSYRALALKSSLAYEQATDEHSRFSAQEETEESVQEASYTQCQAW